MISSRYQVAQFTPQDFPSDSVGSLLLSLSLLPPMPSLRVFLFFLSVLYQSFTSASIAPSLPFLLLYALFLSLVRRYVYEIKTLRRKTRGKIKAITTGMCFSSSSGWRYPMVRSHLPIQRYLSRSWIAPSSVASSKLWIVYGPHREGAHIVRGLGPSFVNRIV